MLRGLPLPSTVLLLPLSTSPQQEARFNGVKVVAPTYNDEMPSKKGTGLPRMLSFFRDHSHWLKAPDALISKKEVATSDGSLP